MSSIPSAFHTKIAWWEPRLKTCLNYFHHRYLKKLEPVSAYQVQALSFCYVLDMMEQKSDKTKADTKRCLSQHKNVKFDNSTKTWKDEGQSFMYKV